ncbi:hypothetical protein AB0E78_09225 [Streptomyces sp. NPDC032198]
MQERRRQRSGRLPQQRQDLGVLAEVCAQWLRQASQGETPTATAANATV